MRYKFMRFPGGRPKALTLSYDDGVRADLRLCEILDKYGLKCTFNLNSAHFIGGEVRPGKITPDEVREHILAKGHEIAVHGKQHLAPGIASPVIAIRDVLDCRTEMENEFDMIIRGMAYPDSGITKMHSGNDYATVRRYLADLGIVYSRTLGGDNNSFMMPADFYAWMPSAHHNNSEIMEYIEKFLNIDISAKVYHAKRVPRLLYIWGHSYEFDMKDNWNHIEEICQKLADNPEIWYATNIEIYDYVQAYKQLVYSADGYMIYNPTLLDVWIDADGVVYKIESGKTLKIDKK